MRIIKMLELQGVTLEVSYNKSLIYKGLINLLFWFSFGLVTLIINWAKVDFMLDMRPQFPELENLIQTKQFVLMTISGFTLYGLLCFSCRKAKSDQELSRRQYFQSLALQELSSVFINFGSLVFVTGFLIENYWYWMGIVLCYGFAYWVAHE